MTTVTSPKFEDNKLRIVEPDEAYEVVDGRIVEELPLCVYEMRMANRLARSINVFDP